MSTGPGITSIMRADTLTAPSSCLSVLRVDRRWVNWGNGCSTGSCARGSTYVHQGSTGGHQFPPAVHAGVIVRVVMRVRGRSLLLIRAADLPSWISCHFPPLVVRPTGVVKSSRSDHLSFLPTLLSSVSAWLPHTRYMSTISRMGVSGGRRAQSRWPAMNGRELARF